VNSVDACHDCRLSNWSSDCDVAVSVWMKMLIFALLAAAAKLVILRERISAACLLAGGTALSRAKMLRLIRYL